jgi:hypothetical protein
MKSFNINCRIDAELRDIIDIVKLRKGGITEFIQKHLREEIPNVTDDEWATLASVRRMAEK